MLKVKYVLKDELNCCVACSYCILLFGTIVFLSAYMQGSSDFSRSLQVDTEFTKLLFSLVANPDCEAQP